MQRDRDAGGLTRVELVVLLFVGILCAGMLLASLGCLGRSRRRPQCASNMRQLGLGFENYNTDYQALPSVHRNIWWLTGVYLNGPVGIETSDPAAPAPDYLRCDADVMRTDDRNGCSYSPNYEAVDPFALEAGETVADNGDARNQAFSPWANYKLAADKGETLMESRFTSLKGLSSSAPSTVLLIENWDAANRAYFYNPPGPGSQAPFVEDGEITCPRPAIDDYNGPAAGTMKGSRWVLTPDGQDESGAFLSLRAFANRARSRGRTITINTDTYHGGRINVLFVDQHVESLDTSFAFSKQPVDTSGVPQVVNPIWTRTED